MKTEPECRKRSLLLKTILEVVAADVIQGRLFVHFSNQTTIRFEAAVLYELRTAGEVVLIATDAS